MSVLAYVEELRSQLEGILRHHPDLEHRWQDGDVEFPAADANGFGVTVQADSHGVIVFTAAGLHEHVDGPPKQAVEEALGLVRDLLSPDMRVREFRSGGRGYRWILERRDASGWIRESQTGLLFWNYFGRRGEHIYQNGRLPGRLGGVAGVPAPE